MADFIQEYRDLQDRLENQELMIESLVQKAMQLEDIGWTRLIGGPLDDDQLNLDQIHKLSRDLRDMAATNPLHVRGAQLRHAYVFGRGVWWQNLTDKTKAILADPYNQANLSSVQAYQTMNLALFTDGTFVLLRDEKTNVTTVVPLSQITAHVTDPDDAAKVRYIKRSWSHDNELREQWYPISRYKKTQVGRGRRGSIAKTIKSGNKNIKVAQDVVAYLHHTNRQAGWTWGVPDSLAAKIWSVAYSGYLQDNSTLVKALSQFAWKVSTANKTTHTKAGIQVAQPGVGGIASMSEGNALSSAGVPSAQVNMNNGQPLAAMVATSFGVPVIALLSSPGATGGSYGAATTLDLPTIKGMTAVQDSWKIFFEEVLRDMGSPDAQVKFPRIETDPAYREVQSIEHAYAAGLLHQAEARDATFEWLDAVKDTEQLPTPNPDYTPSSRGVSGTVPGGVDQGVTNHDDDVE